MNEDREPKWYDDMFKAYQQAPGLLQMLPGMPGLPQQSPPSPGLAPTPPTASSPGASEYAGEDLGIDQQSQMLDQILQELRNISRLLQNAST